MKCSFQMSRCNNRNSKVCFGRRLGEGRGWMIQKGIDTAQHMSLKTQLSMIQSHRASANIHTITQLHTAHIKKKPKPSACLCFS